MSIEPLNAALLVLVGAGAGFVQRVSGFGLGIFAMLFMPHFMPTHTASAAISGLFSCGSSGLNSVKYRKDIRFKTAIPMLCAALVTIPAAVYFSSKVSKDLFNILLGIALILISIFFLIFNKRIKIKATPTNGIISGALGGVLGGLFSTGGPPAVIYLTQASNDKATYFATIQFYFFITNLYTAVFRIFNGIITWETVIYGAIGFIGCIVGNYLGSLVFNRIDDKKMKYIIYSCMIISGIILLI